MLRVPRSTLTRFFAQRAWPSRSRSARTGPLPTLRVPTRQWLIVPLIVLAELANKKNAVTIPMGEPANSCLNKSGARSDTKTRAGRGERPSHAGGTPSTSGHRPHANTDDAIIEQTLAVTDSEGVPVVLVIADLSMQLRAEARGLKAKGLGDDYRLPLPAKEG